MDKGQVAVACLSLARGAPAPPGLAGAWLVSYDPEGNDGNGDANWSHDPAAAMLLTPQEWAVLSTAVPANRPRRPDGKPNRPITMFDLMVVPVKPGELPSLLPMPPAAPSPEPEADFLKRLSRIRREAEARQESSAITQSEADELRDMGLM